MKKVKIALGVLLIVSLFSVLHIVWMPDLSKLKKENPKKTALMAYRERVSKEKGRPFRMVQNWVPLSQISPYLIKAVLIAEDDKFWEHEGFDFEAIRKAMERDIQAKRFKFGGSTITQQLAKNLYLSPEKSLIRKFREVLIAWKMERVLSKRRILEIYMNVVEWGDGIFGAEAASRHYYGKPSSALNPEEAAKLASVLPNPRKYHPMGNQRYVTNRSNLIYNIMIQRGIIIPEYKEIAERSEAHLPEKSEKPEQ